MSILLNFSINTKADGFFGLVQRVFFIKKTATILVLLTYIYIER